MLCLFGKVRNGYVVTHFIDLSCTATSSATDEYVTIPQRVGQKEETASRNEERTGNQPSVGPKRYLNEGQ